MPEVSFIEREGVAYPNNRQSYEALRLADRKIITRINKDGKVLTYFLDDTGNKIGMPIEGDIDQKRINYFNTVKPLIQTWVNAIHLRTKKLVPTDPQKPRACLVLHQAFQKLSEYENEPRMKQLWSQIDDIMCTLLSSDPSYRWRVQHFLGHILDAEKMKLDDSDLFWFSQQLDYLLYREVYPKDVVEQLDKKNREIKGHG